MQQVQREVPEWVGELSWHPVDAGEFEELSAEEKLKRVRHSTAHVMATALLRLQPETKFATGPATAQGFFYDVRPQDGLASEDLERIESVMAEVVEEKQPFEVASIPKAEAVSLFQEWGEHYKLDILDRIDDDSVTLYRNGRFIDLCAGPHVPDTGHCRHFKLLNVSAAHWQREAQPSLTRLTGTAWRDPKSLRRYLAFLEETKARDHRVLGPQLDLFSFHPWAAAALWHPRGLAVRDELFKLWREFIRDDYIEILNPILYRKELFECSGHWEHFRDDMFVLTDDAGDPSFVIKPMNCPDTMLFFGSKTRSYRELPLRVAEGQLLHRNEPTGAIHGIMRTRNFVQDDAHIFLAPEQIQSEVPALLEVLTRVYAVFGVDYDVMLSTRPEVFMGEPRQWDQAEAALREALDRSGEAYRVDEGEGAFYGPKIDAAIRDSLGRRWQCGTIQLDFQLPIKFDLKYSAADGSLQRPIVIHRAIFGSFERFIGVLIEHFGGAFPTWLAPEQAVVFPVGEGHLEYAQEVNRDLKTAGIRASVDSEGSINYRVRAAESRKVPYMLVVGDREQDAGTVSVRRHKIKRQRVMPTEELVEEMRRHIRERTLDVEATPVGFRDESSEAASTESSLY